MGKPCNADGCNNPRWGKGYCTYHQYLRPDKQKKGEPKRSPIRSKSKKLTKEERLYNRMRIPWLEKRPVCEARYEGCTHRSTDVHHIKGRGIWLLIKEWWLAVCRNCHEHIHKHPKQAREDGFLK